MAKTTKDEIPVQESQKATNVSQQVTEFRELWTATTLLDKYRPLLGKQMSANLIAIAELTHTLIPHMQVDEDGVFHEIQNTDR